MAELEIDLGPMLRKVMIEGLADLVDSMPQYRFAVILELLRRNNIDRLMLLEEMGDVTLSITAAEELEESEGFGEPEKQTWDDISKRVVNALRETPRGRGEV